MDDGTQLLGHGRRGLCGGDPGVTPIEIRLPRTRWTKGRIVAVSLGALVMGSLLYRLGDSPSNNPYVLLFIAIPIILIYACYGRPAIRAQREAQEKGELPAESPACDDPRFPGQISVERLLRRPLRVAQELADSGVTGLAFRLSYQDVPKRAPVQAFPVPFEPLPLDEAAEETLALAGGTDCAAGVRASRRGRSRSEWCGLVLRSSRLGLLAISILSVLVLGLVSGQLWTTTMSYVYGVGPWVVVAFVVIGLQKMLRGTRLYIIPGGLIDVKGKRAYLRSKGVMVWYPEAQTFQVTAGEHVFEPPVTEKEAMLALRAWLSSAPAPTDEMIVAFLLGRS